MRIVKVHISQVVVPVHEHRVNSPEYGPPVFDRRPKFIFQAYTDNGLIGLGETMKSTTRQQAVDAWLRLKGRSVMDLCFQEPPLIDLSSNDLFAHENPRAPHRLLERSFNRKHHLGIHAVLLDLAGKHLGVPVSTLLGGAYRRQVRVHAWMGRRNPADSARLCREAAEHGFTSIKCKCALEDDNIAQAQAILDALGPDFTVTMDPSERFYRPAEAMPTLRRLAKLGNVSCIEDPFPAQHLDWHRQARRHSGIPIALSLEYGPWLLEAIRAQACDYVNLGAGAAPWDIRRAGDVCWAAGIPTWYGSGVELGILEALYLHVAAATKAMTRPSDIFGRWLRVDNLIAEPLTVRGGLIDVPTGPGLGVSLNLDAVDRYTTEAFELML